MAWDLIGHTLFHYGNCFEMYIYIITTFVVKAQLYDMKSCMQDIRAPLQSILFACNDDHPEPESGTFERKTGSI